MDIRDVIIIGGGPAGLTAGLYAARARLNVLLVERTAVGGQVLLTHWIENYPGFPEGISGFELIEKMKEQAVKFGLEIETKEISDIKKENNLFYLKSGDEELKAKAVIIATGAQSNKLGVEGEEKFTGRGVSYCATCDGPFFRDQEVAVVGGGDSAIEEAIFLTKFAKKVYVIHRRDALRATKILQERAFNNPKIEIIWDTVVDEIQGEEKVKNLKLRNVKDNSVKDLAVGGTFIFVGIKPNTEFLKDTLEMDPAGFIITDEYMETSLPGVFAAGDVRKKRLRQVSTSVGDGALAAFSVQIYLEH